MSLSGIFATEKPHLKNYIKENRSKIRQMSCKSVRSEAARSLQTVKNKSSVPSAKQKPVQEPADGVEFPRLRTKLFIQCRNQACQTDEKQNVTSHGLDKIIESPGVDDVLNRLVANEISARNFPSNEEVDRVVNQGDRTLLVNGIEEPISIANNACLKHIPKSATSKSVTNSTKTPTKRYLRKTKPTAPPVPPDPDCPTGHVAVPEFERVDMVEKLNQHYHEKIFELNKLPVGADTLRVRARRMELEKQLNEIEESLKHFSVPKVYVKVQQ